MSGEKDKENGLRIFISDVLQIFLVSAQRNNIENESHNFNIILAICYGLFSCQLSKIIRRWTHVVTSLNLGEVIDFY